MGLLKSFVAGAFCPDGGYNLMNLGQLIEGAVKFNASDIHLMEESPPYIRVDGAILPIKHPPISHQEILEILNIIVPERLKAKLEHERGLDVGYQYKDISRCRTIVFFERHRIKIVMRLVPMHPPTFEELDFPPAVKKIIAFTSGLVLITGPAGSGKSTTLAAILDAINSTRKVAIVTIEDPIEYYYTNKMAVISQREVGDDVGGFNDALIQALRQDPNVIMVGEMRDPDTMKTAIKAAETGVLVLSTLHTTNAIQTIERIISNFPDSEHDLLREQLSSNLRAVITQNLIKRAEGKGRIAAQEIIIVNKTISNLIRDNKMNDIQEIMKGGEDGMQVFDQAIANLVRAKKVKEEDGTLYARDVYAFRRFMKGVLSSSDRGGIIGGFGK